MDIWGLSEVAKALCGGVGTRINSRGIPVCSCSGCAPGAGGGRGCVLSGKKWNQLQSKRKQRLTFEKVFFFYPHQSLLQDLEINHYPLRPHFLKKMIYLADHRLKKNSDEYTKSILWLYLFGVRIIESAKLVNISWITNLFVSASHLPHSSVCFRLKQSKPIKKWYPSMSVRNADSVTLRFVHRASCLLSCSIFPLSTHLSAENYVVQLIGQLTFIGIGS